MKHRSNQKIASIITGLFCVALLSGCIKGQLPEKDPTVSTTRESANQGITLHIDFEDDSITDDRTLSIAAFEPDTSLWEVMEPTLKQENIPLEYQDYGGSLGVLITKIGEKKNGDNGKYWQYFVNNDYAKMGASSYLLQPGDSIEWRFTNNAYGL